MKLRQAMLAAALCLSSVGVVSAKSHHIHLSSPTVAGNVQLPPGDYSVKLDGNNAVMLDEDNDKTYTAPVKVESEARKFDQTAVLTGEVNGASHMKAIEFGGSHTRVDFE